MAKSRVQKAKRSTRAQKLKDEKSMRTLDKAIAAHGLTGVKAAPQPRTEEKWKPALRNMDALARQKKPEKRPRADPSTLVTLLAGIDGIKVEDQKHATKL